jgi:hypothetical protein
MDRLVFAALYALAPNVFGALEIVKPDTVIRWHRAGFRAYGVENANGRLRRSDGATMSDEEIQDIVITASLTPRKCLGFWTPFQAILKELGKDVQIRFA